MVFSPSFQLLQVLLLCRGTLGYLDTVLPRDGAVVSPIGYPLTYQAIRYEPLCGTLGDDARFQNPFSVGHCDSVINVYSNNTVDPLAFYDETGVRLKGAVVGGGTDLCMCFALTSTAGLAGDICWWISGSGQEDIWWTLMLDHLIGGAYRPGSAKSLPQCAGVDLDGLKSTWSATAANPTGTEVVSEVGKHSTTTTATSTVAIPSVITLADGQITTSIAVVTTSFPVVGTSSTQGGSSLSRSDKIAIGIGLGIGIPSLILMVVGLCQTGK